MMYTTASLLSCSERSVYVHNNHLQKPCRRKEFSSFRRNTCLVLMKPDISHLTKWIY